MTKLNFLTFWCWSLLVVLPYSQASVLAPENVAECIPTQQQYIVGEQVNNQLPITNPEKVRFTVLPDRSLKISTISLAQSSLSPTDANYAGDEVFNTSDGDISVSKWTKVDQFQATHNLYFGFTKGALAQSTSTKTDNRSRSNTGQLVLEERISKDQFKHRFVIKYACRLLTAPKYKLTGKEVVSPPSITLEGPKKQVEPQGVFPNSISKPNPFPVGGINSGAGVRLGVDSSAELSSMTGLGVKAPVTSPTTTRNAGRESFTDKPIYFQCLGNYTLKLLNKAQPTAPKPVSISLAYEREAGRFEIAKGWDKFTEGGVTAWIDPKENSRNLKGEIDKKTALHATLDSKTANTTTYLILKMDTLRLYVKHEQLSTSLTDTYEGVCTPSL